MGRVACWQWALAERRAAETMEELGVGPEEYDRVLAGKVDVAAARLVRALTGKAGVGMEKVFGVDRVTATQEQLEQLAHFDKALGRLVAMFAVQLREIPLGALENYYACETAASVINGKIPQVAGQPSPR